MNAHIADERRSTYVDSLRFGATMATPTKEMDMSNDIPAFPVPLNPGESYMGHDVCDGMTLRDYFAAKAMQGWATNPDSGCANKVAEWAYAMADAMLEARK